MNGVREDEWSEGMNGVVGYGYYCQLVITLNFST